MESEATFNNTLQKKQHKNINLDYFYKISKVNLPNIWGANS